MKKTIKHDPLGHLSPGTRAWYDNLVLEFEFEPHHLKILQGAAELWDRCQQARAMIDKAGPVIEDRFHQLREHPAVSVERNSKLAFLKTMRELGLDTADAPEPRPYPLPGTQGRK